MLAPVLAVPRLTVWAEAVVLPIEIVVAAPPRFSVVALVLNTEAVAVLVVEMDGLAPFRFNAVALVPVIVGLPITRVPVAAPMLTEVAAPKRLPVRALVLKTETVPLLEVTMDGLAPFKFRVVAFVPVMVGLATVRVPVAAPTFNEVAAPPRFRVVAVVLARLKEAVETVRSPPSMLTSPSTSRLLFTFVVPVAAPISSAVAAPPMLRVVAVVLARLKVVVDTVRSPPSMFRSPSTSRLLLMLVVPVTAPISTKVPAPAKLTVVAVALSRLKVAAEVVRSPPLTARSPVMVVSPVRAVVPVTPRLPPMLVFFSTPSPPSMTRAPVSLSVDWVVAEMVWEPVIVTLLIVAVLSTWRLRQLLAAEPRS